MGATGQLCTGCQRALTNGYDRTVGRFWHGKCKRAYYNMLAFRWQQALPEPYRDFILWRDRYRCQYCGKGVTKRSGNVDHVRPWPYGLTEPDNLVACCPACNKAKGRSRKLKMRRRKTTARLVIDEDRGEFTSDQRIATSDTQYRPSRKPIKIARK